MASSGFKLAAELSSLIFIIWHRCEEMVRMHFGSCRHFIRQNDSAVMHSGKNILLFMQLHTLFLNNNDWTLGERKAELFFCIEKWI